MPLDATDAVAFMDMLYVVGPDGDKVTDAPVDKTLELKVTVGAALLFTFH